MSKERVIKHPDYYKLPNGIECFDVIRYFLSDIGLAIKYLWRHGRKQEEGIDNMLKAIEDLEKAKVCIDDQIQELKHQYEASKSL